MKIQGEISKETSHIRVMFVNFSCVSCLDLLDLYTRRGKIKLRHTHVRSVIYPGTEYVEMFLIFIV